MANIMLVMGKSLVKGTINPKALTGLERFMLAQFAIPDRVPYASAHPIKSIDDAKKREERRGY